MQPAVLRARAAEQLRVWANANRPYRIAMVALIVLKNRDAKR